MDYSRALRLSRAHLRDPQHRQLTAISHLEITCPEGCRVPCDFDPADSPGLIARARLTRHLTEEH